ncbi:hypothetical protein MPTA5024_04915 [Microbispora sp. ATCC PTA-5024]|nr:hypothetical protein MPTA5024_04915 [Microbispora sp. ATCC PTA-5024]
MPAETTVAVRLLRLRTVEGVRPATRVHMVFDDVVLPWRAYGEIVKERSGVASAVVDAIARQMASRAAEDAWSVTSRWRVVDVGGLDVVARRLAAVKDHLHGTVGSGVEAGASLLGAPSGLAEAAGWVAIGIALPGDRYFLRIRRAIQLCGFLIGLAAGNPVLAIAGVKSYLRDRLMDALANGIRGFLHGSDSPRPRSDLRLDRQSDTGRAGRPTSSGDERTRDRANRDEPSARARAVTPDRHATRDGTTAPNGRPAQRRTARRPRSPQNETRERAEAAEQVRRQAPGMRRPPARSRRDAGRDRPPAGNGPTRDDPEPQPPGPQPPGSQPRGPRPSGSRPPGPGDGPAEGGTGDSKARRPGPTTPAPADERGGVWWGSFERLGGRSSGGSPDLVPAPADERGGVWWGSFERLGGRSSDESPDLVPAPADERGAVEVDRSRDLRDDRPSGDRSPGRGRAGGISRPLGRGRDDWPEPGGYPGR